MLISSRETDAEWDKDLELALRAKVEKYGRIKRLTVEKGSNCVCAYVINDQGDVYIRMDNLEDCKCVQRSFDGRFFAMRQVFMSVVDVF